MAGGVAAGKNVAQGRLVRLRKVKMSTKEAVTVEMRLSEASDVRLRCSLLGRVAAGKNVTYGWLMWLREVKEAVTVGMNLSGVCEVRLTEVEGETTRDIHD